MERHYFLLAGKEIQTEKKNLNKQAGEGDIPTTKVYGGLGTGVTLHPSNWLSEDTNHPFYLGKLPAISDPSGQLNCEEQKQFSSGLSSFEEWSLQYIVLPPLSQTPLGFNIAAFHAEDFPPFFRKSLGQPFNISSSETADSRQHGTVVVHVFPDSLAYQIGIRPLDILMTNEGVHMRTFQITPFRRSIEKAGKNQEAVVLSIARPHWAPPAS